MRAAHRGGVDHCASAFSLGNAALLLVRIRAEEAALGRAYADAFAGTPRFIPGGRIVIVSEALVMAEIRRVVELELSAPRAIRPSDRLVDDLGLDSLTLTTLAVELEDRFQIILSDDDATRKSQTVGRAGPLASPRARERPQ